MSTWNNIRQFINCENMVKTLMSYYYTPIRMAKINRDNTKCKNIEKWDPSDMLVKMQTATLEDSFPVS